MRSSVRRVVASIALALVVVAFGTAGTIHALVIEPEADGKSSASILAIAPDSTVLATTTMIEP
jgi:hypothetical protein